MGNTPLELPINGSARSLVPDIVEELDASGHVVSRTGWRDGLPQGETIRYALDGTPRLHAQLDRGLLDGRLRIYDEHGVLIRDANYVAGRLHGLALTYRDGRLSGQEQYTDGLLHGESLAYDDSGNVCARRCYAAGRLHGPSIALHDGVEVRTASYVGGRLEGDVCEYLPDGRLFSSARYHANLLHGKACRYHEDGSVSDERVYVDGKPQGPWRVVVAPSTEPGAAAARGGWFEKWMRG